MTKLLITLAELAELLSLSEATIKNWAYGRKPGPSGFPKPTRIGRRLRYREDDVRTWIDRQTPQDVAVNPAAELMTAGKGSLPEQPKRPRGRPRKLTLQDECNPCAVSATGNRGRV